MSRALNDNVARVRKSQDFPDSSGVKTLHFQCRRCEFDPWSRNQDSTCQMVQPKKKKQKVKKEEKNRIGPNSEHQCG